MDTDESTNETEPSGTTADENPNNVSSSSKDSIENLDAIKKFIEEHDKGQEERNERTEEQFIQDVNDKMDIDEVKESNDAKKEDDTSVASSVMDMILTETENKLDGKKDVEKVDKQIISRGIGNNSMSLSVGTKVEAKDFGEIWHPAVITELDYDELEVLVHYDDDIKKHDEWINVNSPRLRPHTSTAPKTSTAAPPSKPTLKPAEEVKEEELVKDIKEEPKEIKAEEKIKPVFVEGEKCLARWRDNRRFIATIHKDLGDGKYEIIFDDGFHWTCTISRLHKWKPTGKMESLSMDTSQSPATGPQSPIHFGSGPSTLYPNPAFHTHLFDPTRDYLSSKSERREMKRKLNIKEIFNIGQKKQKMQKTEKEKPKVPVEKKPRILKRSLKLKRRKAEVKAEIPDAVASIIGTLKEEISPETESEPKPVVETVTDIVKTENDPVMVVDTENAENVDEDTLNSDNDVHEPLSEGDNSEGDPVMYEEVKLEKFDGPNNDHEEVIDKIKEAISKLEDGLNESLKADSPKVDLFKVGSPKVDSYKIGSPKVDSYKIGSPKVDSYKIGSPKVDYFKVGSPKVDLYNVGSPKVDSYKIGSPKVDSFKVGSPKVDLFKLGSPKVELFRVDSPKLDSPKLNSPRIEGIPTPEPETSDTPTTDIEIITVNPENVEESSNTSKELPRDEEVKLEVEKKVKKVPSKMKKGKKLRILQEKKVKKQVEKVKCELEEMKRQFEEMRKQMLMKTEELSQKQEPSPTVMPESFLLPGEWCCHWVNGQPVGNVSEIEAELKHDAQGKPALPRRSVQVEDKRLPPGWTKHMVRRSVGNSAGKWDVVLVSPENKRFHTKTDMRHYLEANPNEALQQYEHALMDFGVHLKLARRMGWIVNTPDGIAEAPATILPAGTMSSSSPLVKRSKLGIKKKMMKEKRRPIKLKLQRGLHSRNYNSELMNTDSGDTSVSQEPVEPLLPLEDGYVYVGSLKVQVIENLLRCPAEGCYKNFRNNTLIQMHIKHYHRELRKRLGATPKVLDLASARSTPAAPPRARRPHKGRPRAPRRDDVRPLPPPTVPAPSPPPAPPAPPSPPRAACPAPPSLDSPKLRQALVHKPVKRPRVLLPVKRPEPELAAGGPSPAAGPPDFAPPAPAAPPDPAPLDFETAISTHTVTKPLDMKKKKDKRPTSFAQFPRSMSEDEDWLAINSDDLDTRSSFPRSGTPDSKVMDGKMAAMSSESANEDQRDSNLYTYTETGERVKIVHMKREEIINCHCGFREEDGLMVQCELCLCWQHALCHNILKESDVPDKYTCSICLNPRRGRRSKRFIHDQDRMYEGVVCGGSPCGALRRSHDLSGNLLRLDDALHALRVKYYVATKKDHPKLYLWAKDWEQAEITYTQEKLNSDYSDLSIMINGMDKENMPMKPDDVNMQLDMRASPSEELEDRYNPQRDIQLGSQSLLSGLLSSPGGASLDLPISTSELERLAKSVQAEAAASDWQRVYAPQPEAAIENDACRERLLKHIQRCQALIDTRLDSIEAQVAELESQDPSFGEHYETAEFYPRTKQTIQMLMRDLDTMEELGGIT